MADVDPPGRAAHSPMGTASHGVGVRSQFASGESRPDATASVSLRGRPQLGGGDRRNLFPDGPVASTKNSCRARPQVLNGVKGLRTCRLPYVHKQSCNPPGVGFRLGGDERPVGFLVIANPGGRSMGAAGRAVWEEVNASQHEQQKHGRCRVPTELESTARDGFVEKITHHRAQRPSEDEC